jgi:Restriction endonuclease XhoI
MTDVTARLKARLSEAIKQFWAVRDQQGTRQGGDNTDAKDRGTRSAVTGGKHIDGFIRLVTQLLVEAGISGATIYCKARPVDEVQVRKKKRESDDPPLCTQTELPGWFRAEKDWDLLLVVDKFLLAAIEFKSQVGPSFGNNFNNRTEEALGNATDLWAAYREGAFKPSQRPWLGYFMLLEEADGSTTPVKTSEAHFSVFPEFRGAARTPSDMRYCSPSLSGSGFMTRPVSSCPPWRKGYVELTMNRITNFPSRTLCSRCSRR